jgi:hypothetical protein
MSTGFMEYYSSHGQALYSGRTQFESLPDYRLFSRGSLIRFFLLLKQMPVNIVII